MLVIGLGAAGVGFLIGNLFQTIPSRPTSRRSLPSHGRAFPKYINSHSASSV